MSEALGVSGYINITERYTVGVFELPTEKWRWTVYLRDLGEYEGVGEDRRRQVLSETKHTGEASTEKTAHQRVREILGE